MLGDELSFNISYVVYQDIQKYRFKSKCLVNNLSCIHGKIQHDVQKNIKAACCNYLYPYEIFNNHQK